MLESYRLDICQLGQCLSYKEENYEYVRNERYIM